MLPFTQNRGRILKADPPQGATICTEGALESRIGGFLLLASSQYRQSTSETCRGILFRKSRRICHRSISHIWELDYGLCQIPYVKLKSFGVTRHAEYVGTSQLGCSQGHCSSACELKASRRGWGPRDHINRLLMIEILHASHTTTVPSVLVYEVMQISIINNFLRILPKPMVSEITLALDLILCQTSMEPEKGGHLWSTVLFLFRFHVGLGRGIRSRMQDPSVYVAFGDATTRALTSAGYVKQAAPSQPREISSNLHAPLNPMKPLEVLRASTSPYSSDIPRTRIKAIMSSTWTAAVRKARAFWALLKRFWPAFYMLLGSRQGRN